MSAKTEMLKLPNLPVWFEKMPRRAAMERDTECDVAIVGAGYTGLWAAYYILKASPKLRIVIIDRDHVGFGASGRNGGWASAIFPISLHKVAKFSSHEAALHLQAAMNDTVDEIDRVLQAEGIDADYTKQGLLSMARSEAQLTRIASTIQSSIEFGLPDQWQAINAGVAENMVGAHGIKGGLYTEHCALIHSGKLVRGLARVVESLGATIYEGTPAVRIQPRCITTLQGRITADFILCATEAFTCQQEGRKRSVVPLYSLVMATEPLSPGIRTALKLDQRMAFNDLRHLRIYAQTTADGRLIFGGRGAPYRFGSKMSSDLVDGIHANIYDSLIELFPELKDVRISHRWGGALGVSRDFCPSVCLDESTGIAWGGGYVGDGVATSNLAGRLLRNLILKQDEHINRLPIVNHTSPLWEREPWRWLGVNFGLTAASIADSEERLTGRPSQVAKLLDALTGAH